MKTEKVKQIWDNLRKFDYLANKEDTITITEWINGEGWDISINDKVFQLTCGQLDAINYLTRTLDYEHKV